MMKQIYFYLRYIMIGASLLLTACKTLPPVDVSVPEPPTMIRTDEMAILPLIDYLQLLQRMTPAELLRERPSLIAGARTPTGQVRLAMLLGQPRATTDLGKALPMLESVLRSSSPEAISLYPLARALAAGFQERQRLEVQNDKLAQQLKAAEGQSDKLTQQLKASQQRIDELQEKLNALANIERSIPIRPAAGTPVSKPPR